MQQGIGVRERSHWMDFLSQNVIIHRRPSGRGFDEAAGGRASGLVQPFGSLRRFAGVYVDRLFAILAFDRTAPLELTLALCDALHARRIVAPPTAHHLASISPSRGFVTDATSRAQRTLKRNGGMA